MVIILPLLVALFYIMLLCVCVCVSVYTVYMYAYAAGTLHLKYSTIQNILAWGSIISMYVHRKQTTRSFEKNVLRLRVGHIPCLFHLFVLCSVWLLFIFILNIFFVHLISASISPHRRRRRRCRRVIECVQ